MKLIDADKLREQLEKRLDKLYDNLPDSDIVVEGKETTKEAHTLGQYVAIESIIYNIDEAPDLSEVPVTDTPQFEEGFKTGQELAKRDITGWTFIDEKMRNALWNDLQMRYPHDNDKTLVGVDAGEFRDWLNSLPKAEALSPIDSKELQGYDEAYINEKIAKATKTWEGVDVDKYMDEVRGREPEGLDEEITKYWKDISSIYGAVGKEITRFDFDDVCKYFYELGKNGK